MTGRNATITTSVPTRREAITALAEALVDAVRDRAAMNPRAAAEAAYYPWHPLGSVEAIEQRIIQRRAARTSRPAAQAA
jgi:hypothetical protein